MYLYLCLSTKANQLNKTLKYLNIILNGFKKKYEIPVKVIYLTLQAWEGSRLELINWKAALVYLSTKLTHYSILT